MTVGVKRGWRYYLRGAVLAGTILLGGVGVGAASYGAAVYRDLLASLPPTPDIALLPVSTLVLDRHGELLRPFTISDGRWRLPVTQADVDRTFVDLLIAYEDRRFFEHDGVDWSAMLRAAGQFVLAGGHVVSGGSTLTMQVARLIEGEPTRNLMGKLRQLLHAMMLERSLSKEEILTLYLTLAPYGGNIEGIRAASIAWFGKEPVRLTTAQAALLVALPQSPEARRPDRDAAAATAARDMVLDRLVEAGAISADEAGAAKRERVPTTRRDFPMLAAHLTRRAIAADPGARQMALTIDADLQRRFEQLSASRARHLGPELSAAIVVADIGSGDILASVGSADLFSVERDGFVDMTTAVRSPGSTLKPLIYGLGFELGLAHPESLIEDRPTSFARYVPTNFDRFNRGTITIRQALAQSLNIPAVIVLDAVGPARLVSRLRRAHARPRLPQNTAPSLAIGLGGVGITLRDLVSVYAALGNGGRPVVLHDGIASSETPVSPGTVLDPLAAWYVTDILRDVPPPLNGSPGRIAYKTGTSYGYRDAWAIGYDGRTVIGVWVGRPDGVSVPGLSGMAAAAPLLFESFDRLGTPAPFRTAPAGALIASNAELPVPLRRFRHPDANRVARDAAPEIAFPADDVAVDLGLATGEPADLILKVRNGSPPFTFLADGAPFGRSAFAHQTRWTPDGPGYVTLSVVDAAGRSDNVTIFVE